MTYFLDIMTRKLYTQVPIDHGSKEPEMATKIDMSAVLARCSPSRNDMTAVLWIGIGVAAGAALAPSMGSAGYAVGIGVFAAMGAVALLWATR